MEARGPAPTRVVRRPAAAAAAAAPERTDAAADSPAVGPAAAAAPGGPAGGWDSVPRKRLVGLQFGTWWDEAIRAYSVVPVKHSSVAAHGGASNKWGMNDSVMGPVDRSSRCVVCHSTMNDCPGHCGHIDLWIPIPSPFKIDILRRVIDVVCLTCGELLFPVTEKVRQEQLALPSKKRLAAAAKRCQNVAYCGQIQQSAERLRIARDADAERERVAAAAAAAAAADADAEADADMGGDEDEDEDPTSDKDDDDADDDDEDKDAEDDEKPDDDADDDEAEEPEDEGAGSGADEEGDGEEGGGGRRKRRRKPTAAASGSKKGAKASDKPKAKRARGPAGAGRAASSAGGGGGGGGSAAEQRRRPRQLEGEYDRGRVRHMGCGAPVAHYSRDGLRIHATYYLPYSGDASKARWPTYNSWRLYEVLRSMSPENQRLLGFDARHSPVRSLLLRSLLVPPPIVRRKKEDTTPGKSSASSQDDNTQALRDVAMRAKKLVTKLREDSVHAHNQLGSVNRSVVWFLPPPPPPPGTPPSAAPLAGGRLVPCSCTDPDRCQCILAAAATAPPPDGAAGEGVPTRSGGTAAAAAIAAAAMGATGGPRRGGPKGWRDLLGELETALTTYLIGDINKKGASRKDGKPGLSAWANTTGGANAIVKRDRSFAARFVGKHGRIRGTMYGKRCDKTARSVASGDLHQNVGEIGIPREIAETLTVCETLRPYNRARQIDRMRSNAVEFVGLENGELYHTRFKNRDAYVPTLGSIFERHIETGDPVVWNRQPTLHKPSIQGARARRVRHPLSAKARRTLAMNHCLTVATNADFDGDEINLHLAVGPDARAETVTLMSAPQQIRSQQGDSVIICLVQNSRLALYLLTDPAVRFRRHDFVQLLLQFGQVSDNADVQALFERHLVDVPPPGLVDAEGTEWWTGLQVVSALLPPGIFYARGAAADDPIEPAHIVDSQMLSGRLAGRDVCHGESGNLVHIMVQDCGEEIAVAWLSGFQRVLNYFLMQHGATLAPADYDMSATAKHECVDIVQKASRWVRAAAAPLPQQPAPVPAPKPLGEEKRENEGVEGAGRWWGAASGYDMRKNNASEKLIGRVLERSRDLVAARLKKEVEERSARAARYGGRRNGTEDLIHSGAKGKPQHMIQMGAMAGQQMPLCGRVVANVAHFNRTMDTPEAHGYVSECYRDGLSPWAFFCAAIGGREGLVHTGSSTPLVGYFQKRLGTNMSDLHAKADGTIRDCRDQIVQWGYGDDAKDPAFLESNDARFFTPLAHASPELAQLQRALLESRARLYELSRYLPKKFLAPLNLERLLKRAACADQLHRGAGDAGPAIAALIARANTIRPDHPLLRSLANITPAAPGMDGAAVDGAAAEAIVGAWFEAMERAQLLRGAADPRYNLLLDAMLRDALSPWHVAVKLRLTLGQLLFVLNELERALARSGLVSGEAVGPIASQSMGEPATQSTLNLFHFAGTQNTMQSAINRINDTVNATKKPLTAGMTVFLKAPWCTSRRNAELVAADIPERRLMEFVLHTDVYDSPAAWPAAEREWTSASLEIVEPTKARPWFAGVPTMRIEFDLARCQRAHLHLMEMATAIRTYFKRGVGILSSGSFADRWVLYVALAPASFGGPAIGGAGGAAALVESAVVACLQETFVRGLPRVTQAAVVAMDVKRYDERSHKIVSRPEWCIVTQGSNLEGLLAMPAVEFERCATSYVHDVYKLLGIEGARRWLDENIEDLVRSCKSRVDVHHTKLIADIMTRTGGLTPMTRNGLQNSTDSVCRLLFEDVLENIKRGGVHAQCDKLQGVPESIMMGITAPIGTGATLVLDAPPNPTPQTLPTMRDRPPPPPHASLTQIPLGIPGPATLGGDSLLHRTAGGGSPEEEDDTADLRVTGGVREVPCRPRPFRFFQQFVPIARDGRLDPALLAPVPPPAILAATTGMSDEVPSLGAAVGGSAPAMPTRPVREPTYVRRPLWQPPSAARAPPPALPVLPRESPSVEQWWRSGAATDIEIELQAGGACVLVF